MGGERIQRKLKKFKGKQLAGKCTEPERNNKEKGSWVENGKDSNFLNKETRNREKCKLETGTLKKHQTANIPS